ncbi:ketopantoate reductase family protein [Nocardioides lijunqiniae]|uniref:ketopantoate reductase family protein n=1 Tax=Nocardioides lijunqiniae TaxID=2760832 RepID=UPI001878490B|nr:2-dehydropantoate 2-reductase [Nocardioides lijunqiniae]
MRYVVYGTGAVGGVIGGNLLLAGVPVTLVARGEHLARIRAQGLTLDREDGRRRVDAPATDTAADVAWTDDTVVLLCVKGQQTQAALEDLLAHAPEGVPLVCVQNGVANERAVLRQRAATYAVCVMLPATHLEPGVVVQKSGSAPGILDIGRVPGRVDETAEAIAADLRRAGFESVARPDIMAWKHRKLLSNLGNGVDAVFTPGEDADELVRRAQAEGEQVLARVGIDVVTAELDRERRGDHLRRREHLPVEEGGSTWQSVARGGSGVEIDYLAGEVVLLGRLHGVPTPVNEAVQRATHDLVRAGGAPRSVDPASLLA